MHGTDGYMTDTVYTTDLAAIRDRYQIGETISIGIPGTEANRTRFVRAWIVQRYKHHVLCRMPSGCLESFRWLDLATIYSVRYAA